MRWYVSGWSLWGIWQWKQTYRRDPIIEWFSWTVYYTLQELPFTAYLSRTSAKVCRRPADKFRVEPLGPRIQPFENSSFSLEKRNFRSSQIFRGKVLIAMRSYCSCLYWLWPKCSSHIVHTRYWIDQRDIAGDSTLHTAPATCIGPELRVPIAKTIRYRCVLVWRYCIMNTHRRRDQGTHWWCNVMLVLVLWWFLFSSVHLTYRIVWGVGYCKAESPICVQSFGCRYMSAKIGSLPRWRSLTTERQIPFEGFFFFRVEAYFCDNHERSKEGCYVRFKGELI